MMIAHKGESTENGSEQHDQSPAQRNSDFKIRSHSRAQSREMKKSTNKSAKFANIQEKYTLEKEDDMGQIHQSPNKDNQNKWEEESISEDYFMESTMFDYNEIKLLDIFGIKKYSDAIFRGEISNGKRHGKGVMYYKKNRVYEGDWLNDVRHGKGFERYSNNNRYEGDFMNGKAHGKGVYSWLNGEIYDGEWKNGVKEGYGVWTGIFGDSYIGEWKNSKADGHGVHQWKNGDRFEGEWKNCLKHGQGTDIFLNGDSFTGQYKDGKPHGFGQYKWKNGSVYIGEFKDGQKHGKGKWKKIHNTQNCNTYDGEYTNDKKNGFGMFQWESGNMFKGCYKDDERDGYGEMYWVDGSYYKGEWKQGIQHGMGKMTFPDGTIKEGYFENNTFKGNTNISGGALIGGSTDLSSNRSSIGQALPPRGQSRGKSTSLVRQKTKEGQRSSLQENGQIKRPLQLNPVQPPQKKELNFSSDFGDVVNLGYQSPVDSDYAGKPHNIIAQKYSLQNSQQNSQREGTRSLMTRIMKLSPQQQQFQNSQIHSSLNSSTNNAFIPTNINNNNNNSALDQSFLPDIKHIQQHLQRVASKSSNRTQQTMATDVNVGIGMGGLRKASPEALALMIKNLKQNNANAKKAWIPNGTTNKKDSKQNTKKFFF